MCEWVYLHVCFWKLQVRGRRSGKGTGLSFLCCVLLCCSEEEHNKKRRTQIICLPFPPSVPRLPPLLFSHLLIGPCWMDWNGLKGEENHTDRWTTVLRCLSNREEEERNGESGPPECHPCPISSLFPSRVGIYTPPQCLSASTLLPPIFRTSAWWPPPPLTLLPQHIQLMRSWLVCSSMADDTSLSTAVPLLCLCFNYPARDCTRTLIRWWALPPPLALSTLCAWEAPCLSVLLLPLWGQEVVTVKLRVIT